MNYRNVELLFFQSLRDLISDHYRSMPAAGAADADMKI
jgi:hypothetical protein